MELEPVARRRVERRTRICAVVVPGRSGPRAPSTGNAMAPGVVRRSTCTTGASESEREGGETADPGQ